VRTAGRKRVRGDEPERQRMGEAMIMRSHAMQANMSASSSSPSNDTLRPRPQLRDQLNRAYRILNHLAKPKPLRAHPTKSFFVAYTSVQHEVSGSVSASSKHCNSVVVIGPLEFSPMKPLDSQRPSCLTLCNIRYAALPRSVNHVLAMHDTALSSHRYLTVCFTGATRYLLLGIAQ
jgi:hypothetical protein